MDRIFEIDAYRKSGELFVVLRGSLVLNYCRDAKVRLGSLLKPPVSRAYIHLAELEFLDSAGLGVLVGLKMTANRSQIDLSFLSPRSRVEEIFRVSKLDTIFEITQGAEADALRAMLMQSNFCLWRDRKDTNQSEYNTEADFTKVTNSQLTQVVGDGESEQSTRLRALGSDAVMAIRQGDHDRAVNLYRQMLDLDRNNMSALNNLAVIYEKKTEWYTLARESWMRLLELSKQHDDEKHASRARKHLDALNKLIKQ